MDVRRAVALTTGERVGHLRRSVGLDRRCQAARTLLSDARVVPMDSSAGAGFLATEHTFFAPTAERSAALSHAPGRYREMKQKQC